MSKLMGGGETVMTEDPNAFTKWSSESIPPEFNDSDVSPLNSSGIWAVVSSLLTYLDTSRMHLSTHITFVSSWMDW